jgi:hypothetical protein
MKDFGVYYPVRGEWKVMFRWYRIIMKVGRMMQIEFLAVDRILNEIKITS